MSNKVCRDTLCCVAHLFVLPNAKNDPSTHVEICGLPSVTITVLCNLLGPPSSVRFGKSKVLGTTMPKAAIDENTDPLLDKNDVSNATV